MRIRLKLNKLFLLCLTVFLVGGCDQDKNKSIKKIAKGPVFYGGVFKMNEVEDCRSLFPLNITETSSFRVVSQVYEGLVKLNQKDLTIIPCIAEKWESNDSATVFTFHLRKGIFYHNDPCFKDGKGREVTAIDFKYCFDKLCEANPTNQGYWVFKDKVQGANAYYNSTVAKNPLKEGVSGVNVIDEYTLQIKLQYPIAGFLNLLATPYTSVFPKEAVDKYGLDMRTKCVGTGPFFVKDLVEGEAIILSRNESYWDIDQYGNPLPYLDAIKVTFIKEKKSEMLEFKKGNLDMVYQLPFEMINDIIGDLDKAKSGYNQFQLQVTPSMSIQYYGFQHQSELFSNKYLRQAFNYSIDRQKIVDFTLQGEGIPANFGIVPPSLKDYDAKKVKGYDFNPELAKKLMIKAGYPNGRGLSKITLQLNSGGSRNTQIAEVIQKMLKEVINVEIELNIMALPQHLENLETGKTLFWRTAWVADYPDPENFLNLLYGGHIPTKLSDKSYINSVRYKSAKFDSLFSKALRESSREKRYDLFRQADQVAMDDAAIIPLYYDENYRLIQPFVKNFDANAMEYRDFKKVYIDSSEIKSQVR
jgi:oligopeptide transport system substrate-binding protein